MQMTRFRWELQLEGTADGVTWHKFGYHNKPGGPTESLDVRPRTLAPGHFLRSDWRFWFLPLQAERLIRMGVDISTAPSLRPAYYAVFSKKVLEGEPTVSQLVVTPPQLAGRRLLAVRTLMYAYEFSDGSKSATPAATAEPAQQDGAPLAGDQPHIVTLAGCRRNLPAHEWEEGRWWKRRYVAMYDCSVAAPEVQREVLAALAAGTPETAAGAGPSAARAAVQMASTAGITQAAADTDIGATAAPSRGGASPSRTEATYGSVIRREYDPGRSSPADDGSATEEVSGSEGGQHPKANINAALDGNEEEMDEDEIDEQLEAAVREADPFELADD
jgi:hypothetical protein